MTFRFGVVSSYDVLCGNATYSQALLDGMAPFVEPVKIEVPVSVQKCRNKNVEDRIIDAVRNCDGVNIQMELGLFGPQPSAGVSLLEKIIAGSKRVSLTMHRVDAKPLNFIRKSYNSLKRGNIVNILKLSAELILYRAYKRLVLYAVSHDASFIVHTFRERERIYDISPKARVMVHPIVWPDNYCQGVEQRACSIPGRDLFDNMSLPVIGLFGFMSDYKNFLQVVRVALAESDYNVLLVGGTHPESPNYGQRARVSENNFSKSKAVEHFSETEMISEIVNLSGCSGRVASIHSPSDSELVALMSSVDIVVVPYLEVGQSGSGIASMSVQFGKKVLFSDTKSSSQLFKFLNRQPHVFDTQSDLSLRSALKAVVSDESDALSFKEHNFKTNIAVYLESLDITVGVK